MKAPVDRRQARAGCSGRALVRPGRPNAKLEEPRLPVPALGKIARPDVQIGTDARNFVLPHAIDGRREQFGVVGGDPRERGIENREHRFHRRRRNRHFLLLEGAKELGLHLMEQAPLRERIDALKRLGLFERFEV